MPRAVVSPPDNQNCLQRFEPAAQADVRVLEIFEQKRNEVLQITNYLEALYARLLAESAGVTALKVIPNEKKSSPIHTP